LRAKTAVIIDICFTQLLNSGIRLPFFISDKIFRVPVFYIKAAQYRELAGIKR
jgi:hypothetical protein